jgi:hypothetical protein
MRGLKAFSDAVSEPKMDFFAAHKTDLGLIWV